MNRAWGILVALLLLAGTAAMASPLHDAAAAGDINAVRRLLAAGADVNEKDRFGFTPLDIAALRGHDDIVALLSRQTTGWQRATASGYKPRPAAEAKDATAETNTGMDAAPDRATPSDRDSSESKTAENEKVKDETVAPAMTSPAAQPGAGYRVQLSAIRSEQLIAEHEAARLGRQLEGVLDGTSLRIEHAVLDDGGDVWRIRTDPLTQADARALCKAVQAAGHDCFVVPGQ